MTLPDCWVATAVDNNRDSHRVRQNCSLGVGLSKWLPCVQKLHVWLCLARAEQQQKAAEWIGLRVILHSRHWHQSNQCINLSQHHKLGKEDVEHSVLGCYKKLHVEIDKRARRDYYKINQFSVEGRELILDSLWTQSILLCQKNLVLLHLFFFHSSLRRGMLHIPEREREREIP